MTALVLKTKVQTISFEDRQGNLGKQYATSEKRITILEAGDILLDRGIEYKEILKVKYEDIELEVPVDFIENHIIQN